MSPGRPDEASQARPRGRLFRKYVVILVALMGGALLLSGAIGTYFSYAENNRTLAAIQREKALAAAARIEQFVREIERQLGWTTHPLLASGSAAIEQRRVDYFRLLRQVPPITEVSWLDQQGREQVRVSRLAMDVVGSGIDRSGDPRFLRPRSGSTYFSPVSFRKESEPYLTVARAGSGSAGVTVAEVNLKFIWDVVSQIRIGKTGHAYVVDGAGQLIAHPDISLVLKRTDVSALAPVQAARLRQAAPRADEEALIAESLQGRRVLTAWAPVAALDWTVFVEQPLAEAFGPIRASIVRTVIIEIVGVALAVVAGLLLARRMARPIQALQLGAARIATGDLAHHIQVRTGDEIETLAHEFNRMSAQLAESYAGLERKVEERTRELRGALEQNVRLLRELEDKTQALEVADRHKSEFLANMSHELRTPLNAVIGFSEVLLERMFGDINAKQEEYLNDILVSGRHLLSLINDILDLSKIEAGRMELELGTFDLLAAVDDALTLVRERAVRQGIRLEVVASPGPLEVTADERKIKQVLLNLLSNAVKFTPEGGHVSVRVRPLEGGFEVAVADSGIGIARADQAAIFQEFRQVGTDYARKREGTGLGLALARRLVELHGGRLDVESAPGQGSTFTFTIPARAACPAS